MFSLMALRLANQTATNSSSVNPNGDRSSSNAGAIAGGIVGGLTVLIVLVFGVVIYRRRQRGKYDDGNVRRTPPLIPEPYNPYGSLGSEHPAQSLPPGHPYTSAESHARAGRRQRKGQASSSSGRTAAASEGPSHESSNANQDGRPASDSNTSIRLRNEVENLRREFDEIRARGLYEPPPEYT